jgi:hypothetical protein
MDPYKMKKFAAVLAIACGIPLLSSTVAAIEEVIVTGYPQPAPTFDVPSLSSSTVGSYGSSFGFSGGYKDAAIAAAKKQCVNEFAAAQKKACNDKRDSLLQSHIQYCNTLGTAGTGGIAAGGTVAAVGTAVAVFASGPVGWGVALAIGGGGTVAAGGAVVQQEGNYGCRDDANANYQYNTQACINYANKIASDFCSKIY